MKIFTIAQISSRRTKQIYKRTHSTQAVNGEPQEAYSLGGAIGEKVVYIIVYSVTIRTRCVLN